VDVLAHEKLDGYRCATQFLAVAARIIERLPPGNAFIVDQLQRAALSVPLNFAEGVGKSSHADKRRFFGIARGSAMECGALLDAARILGLASDEQVDPGKAHLERIVSMLSKMCL